MDVDALRQFCGSLPGTTEDIKWEDHLCFCVGGKMYAIMGMVSDPGLSIKCIPEHFEYLQTLPDIAPAPYLARYKWVHLDNLRALPDAELRDYLERSYQLVFKKLTRKVRDAITSEA